MNWCWSMEMWINSRRDLHCKVKTLGGPSKFWGSGPSYPPSAVALITYQCIAKLCIARMHAVSTPNTVSARVSLRYCHFSRVGLISRFVIFCRFRCDIMTCVWTAVFNIYICCFITDFIGPLGMQREGYWSRSRSGGYSGSSTSVGRFEGLFRIVRQDRRGEIGRKESIILFRS